MTKPAFTATEQKTLETFTALMWSLSRPGQLQTLPAVAADYPANFLAIGETLLDLETTFYTPDPILRQALARTTARAETPDRAAYQFYPKVAEAELEALAQAPVGTMLYPDQAATLILAAWFHDGPQFTLTGPGLPRAQTLQVGGLPEQFWSLREQRLRYPLGWDLFLIDGNRVTGVPRTTHLEIR